MSFKVRRELDKHFGKDYVSLCFLPDQIYDFQIRSLLPTFLTQIRGCQLQ